MRSVLTLAALLLASSAAFAQPGQTAPQPELDQKSPSIAVGLSLGVTAAGVVTLIASDNDSLSWLGLGALYFGPSTGQWYAGELGGLGLGARALGGVAAIYGFSQLLQSENDCEPGIDGDCSAENARADRAGTRGMLFLLGGTGLWVGSSIADVIFAKRAADRFNQRHALTIAPTALAAPGGRVPGLVVSARF
ncbi:MAG TPA: hypothetical protein VIV40_19630 [Kofleriaceae bacterium]